MDWKPDHVTHRSLMSGRVKRYSVWPTITEQRVGEHCWGVYEVYWRIFGVPSVAVAFYIHVHDSEELVVGDNPFPSKMHFPKLKEGVTEAEVFARERLDLPDAASQLADREKHRVKVCDLLEMYQFGQQEREMGNLLATPIIERTRDAAVELAKRQLPADENQAVQNWVYEQDKRHKRVLEKGGSTY